MTEDPFGHTRMPLGEHLDELRSRLLKGLAAVAIAFAVAWFAQDRVTRIALRPYDQAAAMLERHYVAEAEQILAEHPERRRSEFFVSDDPTDQRLRGVDRRPQAIAVGEGFFFILKICLYFALVLGAPVLLWQLWQFVAAGLYDQERRALLAYFPLSVGAFAAGVLFGYYFMVPYAMFYLNSAVSLELFVPNIKLESFLTFATSLCLAFGAIFQLPLLMTFVGRFDLVTPETFSRYRGHFIVGALVVAAIVTPPDPVTQLMLGIPMMVLYEIGIVGARLSRRSRRKLAS